MSKSKCIFTALLALSSLLVFWHPVASGQEQTGSPVSGVDVSKPLARSFALARCDLEEDFLDAARNLAALTCADRDLINRADGRDFGGCA